MKLLARAHGVFYLVTGLWPLFDIDSFQAVTGAKTDLWLVKTVGLLISVIGAALVVSSRRATVTSEVVVLAAGSALALGAIDVFYAATGVISKVYLLDAPAEAALAGAWILLWIREKKKAGEDESPPALPG
ncbi:MAG TPA: hypothetical protein VM222_06795 [Planctomycetota bacterium]|nr:hypothetical protein [Planctomycetota bacterium]